MLEKVLYVAHILCAMQAFVALSYVIGGSNAHLKNDYATYLMGLGSYMAFLHVFGISPTDAVPQMQLMLVLTTIALLVFHVFIMRKNPPANPNPEP